MIESINIFSSNIQNGNFKRPFFQVNNPKSVQLSSDTRTASSGKINKSETVMPSIEIPEQLKKELEGLHDVSIEFAIHEDTGKTMIKIVDRESKEVIREIPSEEDLERAAKFRTFIGQLFDAVA